MNLFSNIYGSGPSLLILHGLFGSHQNWAAIATSLASDFEVHALDLRNHGSSPHSAEMNYTVMTQDVVEYLNGQRIAETFLLGHSLGGKVAMQLALSQPATVSKLIIVDIAPKEYKPRHRELLDAMLLLDLKSVHCHSDMEKPLEKEIPDLSVRRFLLKNVRRGFGGAFYWQLNLAGINRNYDDLNKSIPAMAANVSASLSEQPFTKPTLLIRGARSDYVSEDDLSFFRKLFPAVQTMAVPNTGHWVHAEAAGEFVQIVRNFLRWSKMSF